MRNIAFATLFALGLCLIGTSGAAAAPINATSIWSPTTAANRPVEAMLATLQPVALLARLQMVTLRA